MRVKYKSACYVIGYGGSIKRVEKVLREDNPRVPARLVAKEFKRFANFSILGKIDESFIKVKS